jgi:peptide/nickel transport system substrate-binding protein
VPGGFLFPGSTFARSHDELADQPGYGRNMGENRAEARRLLAEAGVPNLSFTLNGRSVYTPVSVYLIDQWRQIGVTVKNNELENAPFFASASGGSFEAVYDFVNEYSDDPVFLFSQLQSYDRTTRNFSRFVDRDIDALYDRLASSTNPVERIKLARDYEARLLSQAYTLPVFWGRRIVPIASNVDGFHLTPNNYLSQDLLDVSIRN